MLSRSQLRELYYWLQLNRLLEDRLISLYRTGKVVGGLYSSRGQEAISIGTAYALQDGDFVAPMIRNLGAILVRGFRPQDILTQYMARRTSPSGGRECNIHIGDLAKGIIAPISMLGALIPVMAGVALAAKLQQKSIVALTYIGDGGTSTSDFHEGLNFAAVKKVPLILVIENNGWAYSTPTRSQTSNTDFMSRAQAYGVAGFRVDGNDVVAVHETTSRAAESVRTGGGPAIIVADTMRMKGHAEHDDARYVPKEELEYWRARDPILVFERYVNEGNFISDEERDSILNRVRFEVDRATEFAEMSPFPEGVDALGGTYHEGAVRHPEFEKAI